MNESFTIVSTADFSPPSLVLLQQAAPNAAIHQFPKANADEVPADVLARAHVYYAFGRVPERSAAPKLQWVQTNWAGVDTAITSPIFKTGEVMLTSGAGIHAINMGEYTLMMMLALAHKLPSAFKMMNAGAWSSERAAFMPIELRGATLVLIGYGWIGKEIARLAQAFGMRVLAMRHAPPEAGRDGDGTTFGARHQLHTLLQQADFVVLVVPDTPETRGMIDAHALAHMKPSSFMINIGRGTVVDEAALVAALREGRMAGAALDVFAEEPLPADNPLWQLAAEGCVILTPHIAGQTPNYESRAAALFAENLRRFVHGKPLVNQVDFARGY